MRCMDGDSGNAVVAVVLVGVALWSIAAVAAAAIAADRGRSSAGFFFATLFLLGPLGVGVALLAARELNGVPVGPRPPPTPEKRNIADSRRRFTCPRCGADNDIPSEDTAYDCWRCNEHRAVRPKATSPNPIHTNR